MRTHREVLHTLHAALLCSMASVVGAKLHAQDSATVQLYNAAHAARARADSLSVFVTNSREAIRALPRDTTVSGGARLAIWKPWASFGRTALAQAADSMRAIFGPSSAPAIASLGLDITPQLSRDGTPLIQISSKYANLTRIVGLDSNGASRPALQRAVSDTTLAAYLVAVMTHSMVRSQMDSTLRAWIAEEPSFVIPNEQARQAVYRKSVSRSAAPSARECLLGQLEQCPRVFGLRGNVGDAVPAQRALLLRHALMLGGPDAFARLMRDTTAVMGERLSQAANKPIAEVIQAWHTDLSAHWRPDAPTVAPSAVASSLLCCAMLGFVFVRSRR